MPRRGYACRAPSSPPILAVTKGRAHFNLVVLRPMPARVPFPLQLLPTHGRLCMKRTSFVANQVFINTVNAMLCLQVDGGREVSYR